MKGIPHNMRTGPVINESYAVSGQANERSENCAKPVSVSSAFRWLLFRVFFGTVFADDLAWFPAGAFRGGFSGGLAVSPYVDCRL